MTSLPDQCHTRGKRKRETARRRKLAGISNVRVRNKIGIIYIYITIGPSCAKILEMTKN